MGVARPSQWQDKGESLADALHLDPRQKTMQPPYVPHKFLETSIIKPLQDHKVISKEGKFHFGNYNRYYGYRNSGANEADPRLALLRKEWLEGRDCLDIGCNTGQVSVGCHIEFLSIINKWLCFVGDNPTG